jgi:hypothetical protein
VRCDGAHPAETPKANEWRMSPKFTIPCEVRESHCCLQGFVPPLFTRCDLKDPSLERLTRAQCNLHQYAACLPKRRDASSKL